MTAKSRLLIYSDCYIFGGSENVITNILHSPALHQGYDITFLYAYNKAYYEGMQGKLPKDLPVEVKGLPVIKTEHYYHQYINAKKPHVKLFRLSVLLSLYVLKYLGIFSLINFFILRHHFKKTGADILYINNGGYPGASSCITAVYAASGIERIKKILFNVNNLALPQKNMLQRRIDRFVNKHVTFFITASQAAGSQLHENRRMYKEKIHHIPNTSLQEADLNIVNAKLRSEENLRQDQPVIIAAGQLTKRKGFDVLLRSCAEIRTALAHHNTRVIIYGAGEEKAALEKYIVDHKLGDIVSLGGFKHDILNYIVDADMFVLPSVALEDFPYVIVEAMMLGKPVIGTRVAGIPEQVRDGITGYVVEPGDHTTLANRILHLMENRPLLKKMGDAGRERYQEYFSYDKTIHKLISLLNKN